MKGGVRGFFMDWIEKIYYFEQSFEKEMKV
jgi:endo-alpha-1,4-polygalactosaminidase (GH114 family)